MRKTILRMLIGVFAFLLLLFVSINNIREMHECQEEMVKDSKFLFQQIEAIMKENETELYMATAVVKDNCMSRARAASTMLQAYSVKDVTIEELDRIAQIIGTDEINLFDEEGTLFMSSVESYIGCSMEDGEQIGFFLPMLDNKELSLCQEVTPNTAEKKNMQYAAVWSQDKTTIVQIGFEPETVINLSKNNEISHIMNLLADKERATVLAVSPKDNTIVSSTNKEFEGEYIESIEIPVEKMAQWGEEFFISYRGVSYICVFENAGNVILGRMMERHQLYKEIRSDVTVLVIYSVLISGVVIHLLAVFLDKKIVSSIENVNVYLKKVAEGDLSQSIKEEATPEFSLLSHYVNYMVAQLKKDLYEDYLTGLYSRRAFYDLMEKHFESADKDCKAAVFMIDADNLKKVNDQYGHQIGDQYLMKIANKVSSLSVENKYVARLSGDEFAVFIYDYDNNDVLNKSLSELKAMRDVDYLSIPSKDDILISFSVGVSVYPVDGQNFHELLKRADQQMYQDKQNRKKEK